MIQDKIRDRVKYSIQEDKNNTKETFKINDGMSKDQPKQGYISLPDKLPLGVFFAWLIQFLGATVIGVGMYYNIKSEQQAQRAKIEEIASNIQNNMYTKTEAQLRLELTKSEFERLRSEVVRHEKKYETHK